MELSIEYVIVMGLFLGVLLRTILPALKKWSKPGEDFVFQIRYLFTAIVVIIISGVTAFTIFPSFVIPEGTAFNIFVLAFLSGWGANDLFNTLVK